MFTMFTFLCPKDTPVEVHPPCQPQAGPYIGQRFPTASSAWDSGPTVSQSCYGVPMEFPGRTTCRSRQHWLFSQPKGWSFKTEREKKRIHMRRRSQNVRPRETPDFCFAFVITIAFHGIPHSFCYRPCGMSWGPNLSMTHSICRTVQLRAALHIHLLQKTHRTWKSVATLLRSERSS